MAALCDGWLMHDHSDVRPTSSLSKTLPVTRTRATQYCEDSALSLSAQHLRGGPWKCPCGRRLFKRALASDTTHFCQGRFTKAKSLSAKGSHSGHALYISDVREDNARVGDAVDPLWMPAVALRYCSSKQNRSAALSCGNEGALQRPLLRRQVPVQRATRRGLAKFVPDSVGISSKYRRNFGAPYETDFSPTERNFGHRGVPYGGYRSLVVRRPVDSA
jgi:hypothetical protein